MYEILSNKILQRWLSLLPRLFFFFFLNPLLIKVYYNWLSSSKSVEPLSLLLIVLTSTSLCWFIPLRCSVLCISSTVYLLQFLYKNHKQKVCFFLFLERLTRCNCYKFFLISSSVGYFFLFFFFFIALDKYRYKLGNNNNSVILIQSNSETGLSLLLC